MRATTATSTLNQWFLTSPNPKPLFIHRLYITTLTLNHPRIDLSSISRARKVKCSNNDSPGSISGENFKEMMSDMVDERVEELLNKEENRILLDGLEKATQRVEKAKSELDDIERKEIEAKMMRDYISKLESRASEIAECQRVILQARSMVEEAEQSLTAGDGGKGRDSETYKNEERLESIKAALISAIIGTLARLPISLTRVTSYSELIFPLAITFASCALYGVTFRYAIRRNVDDSHLKSGTCGAFGFVKGLATLEGGPPLQLDADSLVSHALDGAVYISENLFIFLFAAVGLDFCIKTGILSPFPIDRPAPKI